MSTRVVAGASGLADVVDPWSARSGPSAASGTCPHRIACGRPVTNGLGLADAPGLERRQARVGREWHQMRAAAVRERQVEDEAVVDRVEAAYGEEREVLAVGGEHRLGVGEAQRRDVEGLTATADLHHPEMPERLDARCEADQGQPSGVRGEGRGPGMSPLSVSSTTRSRAARRPCRPAPDRRHGHHPERTVMARDGQRSAIRRRDELQHPAEPAGGHQDGWRRVDLLGVHDLDRVVAIRVGHPGDPVRVAQDGG